MHTKLEAADFATKNGIEVAVMAGDRPERIYDLLEGRGPGRYLRPTRRKRRNRKEWLPCRHG